MPSRTFTAIDLMCDRIRAAQDRLNLRDWYGADDVFDLANTIVKEHDYDLVVAFESIDQHCRWLAGKGLTDDAWQWARIRDALRFTANEFRIQGWPLSLPS